MPKVNITNKTYISILWLILMFDFFLKVYNLFVSFKLIYLLSLLFTISIIILLIMRNQKLKLMIKISTIITMVGSGLQFLGVIIFLVSRSFDKIKILSIINNTIAFAIAYYLYLGSDKYIEIKNEENN
ncbi:MAG: hypothetical protein KatS3mg027_1374 [Bacteroidia bacterium]|nr:MAG: hypothetical protein KatS3mg027_1374 [Bacteroidia bacterium]